MAAVMYGATGDGELVELRETAFAKEVDLQDFLSKHPALLAGDQMNPSDPRRFILVTPEAGIAIAEGSADYFSLDHLFIDQDGIPTLVEVKRSTDTRLRREVIGQMLEYAANACAYWDAGRLRSVFERRCEKAGLSTDEELAKLGLGPDQSVDEIWEKVAQNLKQERLRLVFLSDKFSPETHRIIEFLNRQVQATEVFTVEVPLDLGGGIRTLVPRVLNPSVLQADRRAAAAGRGELWTAERFYQDLAERNGPEAVRIFRQVHQWAEEQPRLTVLFGRGKSDGSIKLAFKRGDDATVYQTGDVVILTLWSYGLAEIEFQYLMARAPFAATEKRKELWQRLTTGSSLKIAEDRIDLRPSVKWSDLADPNNIRALIDAMKWVVDVLSAETT
jgi:hypothetical protein